MQSRAAPILLASALFGAVLLLGASRAKGPASAPTAAAGMASGAATASAAAASSLAAGLARDAGAADHEQMTLVAQLLLDGYTANLICPNATYAFCGKATCVKNNDGLTATCGCELITTTEGRFSLSDASAVLVGNPTFRDAVLAAYRGNKDGARDLICGAVSDGTLFEDAGLPTKIGSFFKTHTTTTTTTAVTGAPAAAAEALAAESDDASSRASCMGAPCTTEGWAGGCGASCVCAFEVTDAATSSAESSDCLINDQSAGAGVAWSTLGELELLVAATNATFDGGGRLSSHLSAGQAAGCRSCSVV